MKDHKAMAAKLTHEMVYEQCGTMKKYYDPDYAREYPKMLEAVKKDHNKRGVYPTDEQIAIMIAGTALVLDSEKELAGPLCPNCEGVHDAKRLDHADPGDVADMFAAITKVIDDYNS